MPVLLMTLPNGLQVYRSSIQDIFGSSLIFAGPHSVATVTNSMRGAGFHGIQILFTQVYQSYRDSLYSDTFDFGSSSSKEKILPMQSYIGEESSSVFPTAIEYEEYKSVSCGLAGGPSCSCENRDPGDIPHSFCKCCYAIGSEPVLGVQEIVDQNHQSSSVFATTKSKRPKMLESEMQEKDDAETKITYRCRRCSQCVECKNSDQTREISISSWKKKS